MDTYEPTFMPDATMTVSQPASVKPVGKSVFWPVRRAYSHLRVSHGMAMSAFNFCFRRKAPRHALTRTLIVSLTSYPPRFPTLALTLRCLLSQSVRPDRIILWVTPQDERGLPQNVLELQQHGLEIRTTSDIGPFKKIIPALQAFPEAVIATADDDIYYWRNWLEELTTSWSGATNEIVCHRANAIVLDSSQRPRPYRAWPMGASVRGTTADVLPTGVQGVLYPPGALAPRVLDCETFTKTCPRADDIWLYWMARLAGSKFKLTGRMRRPCMWRNSQDVALHKTNVLQDGNDSQIAAMIETFGWPPGDNQQK